ncbi:MAG: ROK family protein [Opitutaceae bacterium]|nr:ROK family protein [Opitutaceae bacterium]
MKNSARASDPKEAPSALAVGLDIGGTMTKLGLVDRAGRVHSAREFPTRSSEFTRDAFFERLFAEIRHLMSMAPAPVIGIGACFLGWIDPARTGPFLCMNLPELHGTNVRGLLENEFHLPVVVNDDVSAHTLAEYTYGSGRGARRFLALAMGTGLAAGVIIDGQPLRFTGGCCGDTGHLILRPDSDIVCSAGCHGCGEALIGTENIARLGRSAYGREITARELIADARSGREPAVSVMREIGAYTGELLASLAAIFLPEVICLVGGTARAGTVLLEAVRARFEALVGTYHRNYARLAGDYYRGVQIRLGELTGETGVIGSTVELFTTHP